MSAGEHSSVSVEESVTMASLVMWFEIILSRARLFPLGKQVRDHGP